MEFTYLSYLTIFERSSYGILNTTLSFFLTKKFFLALVRQPQLVKSQIFPCLKYTYTDGLGKRIWYAICFALPIVLTAVLFNLFSNMVIRLILSSIPYYEAGAYLYIISIFWLIIIVPAFYIFLESFIWLFPYIVQDTLSEDNQGPALSYFASLSKSIRLSKPIRLKYVGLLCFELLLNYLFTLLLNSLSWEIILGPTVHLLLIIKFLTVELFLLVLKTSWANALMAQDDEIVDYGED